MLKTLKSCFNKVREKLEAIRALKPQTTAAFFIISVVSGYFNYLAGSDLLVAGMPLVSGKGAAIAFAIAVGTVIFLFWSYVLAFLPLAQNWKERLALLAATLTGCALILAISSWMNASALAGVAAQERDLSKTLSVYQEVFDEAHRNALTVRQLLPFIRAEENRYQDMSACEKRAGCLTGSAGSGAVTATLDQVGGRLTSLEGSVTTWLQETEEGAKEGQTHFRGMQDLINSNGDFERRLSAYSDHAVALEGIMAKMTEQSLTPAIRQTAQALHTSIVMPATSARSAALAGKQQEVMASIAKAVKETGTQLAAAASKLEEGTVRQVPAFKPLSRAEAVVVYARDFLPAWCAAIAIDLMPLVIILMLAIVRAGEDEEPEPAPFTGSWDDDLPPSGGAAVEDFEAWLERRPATHGIEEKAL